MEYEPTKNAEIISGIVIQKNRGHYRVQVGNRDILCTISSKLRKNLIYPTAAPSSLSHRVQKVAEIDTIDPLAIGDLVNFVDAGDSAGMIVSILPRKNQLSRRAAGDKPLEQVIVANVDQVVVVFAAAQPAPKWNLLDRYLVSIEAAGLIAYICITKSDLVDPQKLEPVLEIYRHAGYPVLYTSTVNDSGIQEFCALLKGKTSLLMGKSGVGKSSLLNAVEPGLGLRVNQVGGGIGKGKHTTTHLEMYPLAIGGGVIDTPGMREFSPIDYKVEDLAVFFPEMRPYLGKCQFGVSCTHRHEPECAIKEAVQSGGISAHRYKSYLKLAAEY